jgi:hypothetical protein
MNHAAEPDERQQQERDRPVCEYLDAVETVVAFIGGDEGARIRVALLDLAHLPLPVPPREQAEFHFDGASIPF